MALTHNFDEDEDLMIFENFKKHKYKVALELGYGLDVCDAIMAAESKNEVYRILKTTREKGDYYE